MLVTVTADKKYLVNISKIQSVSFEELGGDHGCIVVIEFGGDAYIHIPVANYEEYEYIVNWLANHE